MQTPEFTLDEKTGTVTLNASDFLALLANQQPPKVAPDKPARLFHDEKLDPDKPLCHSRYRGIGKEYLCERQLGHTEGHWNDDLGVWR